MSQVSGSCRNIKMIMMLPVSVMKVVEDCGNASNDDYFYVDGDDNDDDDDHDDDDNDDHDDDDSNEDNQ